MSIFRRRARRTADPRVERALRASLTRNADRSPSAADLTERILASIDRPASRYGQQARSRRVFVLPAIAAAGAVAAVAAVAVGIQNYHPTSHRPQVADSVVVPEIRSTPPSTPGTPTPTAVPVSPAQPSAVTAPDGSHPLRSVTVVDLTFTADNAGWGLASADCLSGPGRCTALLRTTDGQVWHSLPGTPFHVTGVDNCSAPCVTGIRFVNNDVGYAYGPGALYMTTDGAQKWRPLSGGADALEALDGNVIRVVRGANGFSVQIAKNGVNVWTDVALPGSQSGSTRAVLSRSGGQAYLLGSGGSSGSVLWTSADNGASWTNQGQPCPQGSATAVSSATDGSATVFCTTGATGFTATSTAGGQAFRAHPATTVPSGVTAIAAASSSTLLVASDVTYRSNDGGAVYGKLTSSTPGRPIYLGFASPLVVHAVSADGATIWTSPNAGRTWTAVTFG